MKLKKLFSLLLALVLCLTLLPISAGAKNAKLTFIGPDGAETTIGSYFHIEQSDNDTESYFSWAEGRKYYAIEPGETVEYSRQRLNILGDVILILGDGATFTVTHGIRVNVGQKLTICCQKGGTGKLIVTGDGKGEDLIAPRWSRRKREVLNAIDAEFRRRGTFQGVGYRG